MQRKKTVYNYSGSGEKPIQIVYFYRLKLYLNFFLSLFLQI